MRKAYCGRPDRGQERVGWEDEGQCTIASGFKLQLHMRKAIC